MNASPNFPLHSAAELPALSFTTMRTLMLHEAEEHDLPILTNKDDELVCGSPFGTFGITTSGQGLRLNVNSDQPDRLFALKESLVEHLAYFVPEALENLRWSEDGQTGLRPPNFQFAKVVSVTPLGACFMRLVLEVPDATKFKDDSIHFRLLLPNDTQGDVHWPTVAANGSISWPTGEHTLHKPVYTTRRIDYEAKQMTVDIFIHDGGRITQWLKRVQAGAQIAVVGPAGGGVIDTHKIAIYGDETAFPAIARILEALPNGAVANVSLLSAMGADCQYPMPQRPEFTFQWITGHDGDALMDAALADLQPPHFWFAAEKSTVAKMREALKACDYPTEGRYLAAYWARS